MEGIARSVLEICIAANVAILLATALLWLSNRVVDAAGHGRDWVLKRRLTALAWVSALALPLIWFVSPALLPASGLNATDLLVGHFLRGHIDMSASELTELLALRDTLPRALLAPHGPVWIALATLLGTAALIRAGLVLRAGLHLRQTLDDTAILRRTRAVTIRISERCAVPFATRGLRRSHVVLPAYLSSDPRAFRIALGHELQHIRQGDPVLELAVAALSPIFALNPAFWSLARQTRRLREHDCDAACVARPTGNARDYSLTLLAVANRAAGLRSAPGTFSVPFLGRRQMGKRATRSQLGHRIEILAQPRGRKAGLAVTAPLLLAFALSLGTTAWLLRSPTDWSHERLQLSSVLNLERLEHINTLGQRPLR